MKQRVICFAILLGAGFAAYAGPLKVLTYPVVHPVNPVTRAAAKAVKATGKGLFKAGKAVLW